MALGIKYKIASVYLPKSISSYCSAFLLMQICPCLIYLMEPLKKYMNADSFLPGIC